MFRIYRADELFDYIYQIFQQWEWEIAMNVKIRDMKIVMESLSDIIDRKFELLDFQTKQINCDYFFRLVE